MDYPEIFNYKVSKDAPYLLLNRSKNWQKKNSPRLKDSDWSNGYGPSNGVWIELDAYFACNIKEAPIPHDTFGKRSKEC
jgi:hypothetical protein